MVRRALLIAVVSALSLSAMEIKPPIDNAPDPHTTAMILKVSFEAAAPENVVVELLGIDKRRWQATVATESKTELAALLTLADFACVDQSDVAVPYPLAFHHIWKITLTGPEGGEAAITSADVRWERDPNIKFPWDEDPAPAGREGDLTFWPGAHRGNGGHFAWRLEPNGLLINNVNFNSIERAWYYFKPGRDQESFQFNYGVAGATAPERKVVEKGDYEVNRAGFARRFEYEIDLGVYADDAVEADWTSFRWRRDVKAGEGKPYRQEVRYSILAPGVQVETDAPAFEFSFQDGQATRGPAAIVITGSKRAKLIDRGETFDPSRMPNNHLVLLSNDGTPEIPVMLVFQHRPEKIEWTESKLVVHRAAGVGTIGLGTPFGAIVLDADTLARWSESPKLVPVERLNRFADPLAAYAWKCVETFAVSGGDVLIRDQIEFLPWQDDWNTEPARYSPIPPLVSYCVDQGHLPADCLKDVEDFDLVTKWGPYRARQGDRVDYKLPIPRAWDYYPLAAEPTEEHRWLHENLVGSLSAEEVETRFGPAADPNTWAPGIFPHCSAHDFSAGGWRASNYMSDQVHQRYRELTRCSVMGSLFPQNYRYRHDPVTGAQYVACTSYGSPDYVINGEGIADIDYWQGLVLYGLYTHAKYAAMWPTMADHWPTIRSMASYWEALHSWVMMGPGAREAGEMYHGDMPTAGYAGLVGFRYLANRLGTDFQRDLGAYLLAKNAVPMIAKFGFVDWAGQLCHQEVYGGVLCNGFGERWVGSFNTVSADAFGFSPKDPWWRTGCIGPQSAQPETLDVIAHRAWDDIVPWETQFISLCPNEGFIRHDPVRVMPHAMLRAYLTEELRASGFDLLKNYHQRYMLRDAHVAAAMLSWDCPVRLIDWSPAYIESGRWDRMAETATIAVNAEGQPAQLRIAATMDAPAVHVDGQAVEPKVVDDWRQWTLLAVEVGPGQHKATISSK